MTHDTDASARSVRHPPSLFRLLYRLRPRRAAIFLGQMYFVINTREHIRTLSDHFDMLIRAVDVQAHEIPGYVLSLKKFVRE